MTPYWTPPASPPDITLVYSDALGHGDIYRTSAGDWFYWAGLGWALSASDARAWIQRAKWRERRRARSRCRLGGRL